MSRTRTLSDVRMNSYLLDKLITRSSYRHPVSDLSVVSIEELRSRLQAFAVPQRKPFLHNWAGEYGTHPRMVLRPRSEEEVRYVVELARREGRSVRCFGSLHSPSDLALGDDYMVSLDELSSVIKVDKEKQTIEAQGGMRLRDFIEVADSHGLALSNLGSICDQSLAGAIATATHGAGVDFGNMSTMVKSMTIVTSDASILTVNNDRGHDLFRAALCSLGLLGVVIRVEFQLEPAFDLEEEVFCVSWDYFIDNYELIARSGEHVRMYWFSQLQQVKISRLSRTSKPRSPPPSLLQRVKSQAIGRVIHPLALATSRIYPDILIPHSALMYTLVHRPALLSTSDNFTTPAKISVPNHRHPEQPLESYTTVSSTVDRSDKIFTYDCGPPQYTFEGVVPFEKTVECLKDLQRWLSDEMSKPDGLRPHFPIELRPTAGDDIWLSPTYKMTGTYIGPVQYRPFGLHVPHRELFAGFESRIVKAGGRPHWAKSHTCSQSTLRRIFPKLDDFLAIRKRLDPDGVFLNPYTRRHLLGEVGEEVDMVRFKII